MYVRGPPLTTPRHPCVKFELRWKKDRSFPKPGQKNKKKANDWISWGSGRETTAWDFGLSFNDCITVKHELDDREKWRVTCQPGSEWSTINTRGWIEYVTDVKGCCRGRVRGPCRKRADEQVVHPTQKQATRSRSALVFSGTSPAYVVRERWSEVRGLSSRCAQLNQHLSTTWKRRVY